MNISGFFIEKVSISGDSVDLSNHLTLSLGGMSPPDNGYMTVELFSADGLFGVYTIKATSGEISILNEILSLPEFKGFIVNK